MPPFRLAHLSDPHLPPPAGAIGWRDIASKRLLSGVAWRRKGRGHRREVLDALVADIAAYAPDHMAITGDLTNFSSVSEFDAARLWLESLGPPADVTVSPGNHDALVGDRAGRFEAWGPWLGDDMAASFPHVRERDGVVLINACSARPSAPHLATGRLGDEQLARLEAILRTLAQRNLARVLILHHPPVEGVVPRRKSLDDGAALRALLCTHGVDLVLHGHGHEAAVSRLPGPGGDIPVLGVPSASASVGGPHPAARWHAIEIARSGGATQVRVTARGLGSAGAFESLGSYRLGRAQPA